MGSSPAKRTLTFPYPPEYRTTRPGARPGEPGSNIALGPGRLAQLVRASVLHTEGQRFESSIAHHATRGETICLATLFVSTFDAIEQEHRLAPRICRDVRRLTAGTAAVGRTEIRRATYRRLSCRTMIGQDKRPKT